MKCKYCGADVNNPECSPVVTEFYCGSMVAASCEWSQSNYCELQKYKEMFPVAPWDDGPITAEVCDALGGAERFSWSGRRRWIFCERNVHFTLDVGVSNADCMPIREYEWVKTAGQLAMLVAARRA